MTAGPIKSKAWRDRAEEYRVFAAEAQSPDARRAYLEVAQSCDRIAVRLERLEDDLARRGDLPSC
ncbi:MAG TPA: hypothetical protein VMB81_23375 [Candidatus Sulfotelmatobacter sp.]|nr:hypothetical protein [Candidatus Sulfotelmatobacter sp.]